MNSHATRNTQYASHVLIIGGTAAYGLDLTPYHPLGGPITVDTPYGASPAIFYLQPNEAHPAVAFCSRHGKDTLSRSAAFLDHRAMIWAAKTLGISTIFSWNGTGAIASDLEVGDLVIPSDLLDFTRTRITTFDIKDLVGAKGPVFAADARAAIQTAARATSTPTIHAAGIYVCTEGPRLETSSEIALYHSAGADLVGMTLSPEVFLAQEVGIAYASLCYISNYATGRAGDRTQKRQFGPEVAHTCLPILLDAARHRTTTLTAET
ncbi:MAG: MTAP family purine nucleoside phosphorylase [Chloroflexi bacterium]|nr:MTAP family purine nucleoside phosphorylase [Chloroflexota bacterium]